MNQENKTEEEELDTYSVYSHNTGGINEAIESETLDSNKILLLQFEPEFQCFLMFGILLAFYATFLDAVLAWSTKVSMIPKVYWATLMGIIYFMDVIYAVDILSMLAYKDASVPQLKHLHVERSTLLLFLDVVSIIPLDAVYFALADVNMQVMYTIRLRYCLRLFRFIKKVFQLEYSVDIDHIVYEYVIFVLKLTTSTLALALLNYTLECFVVRKLSCKPILNITLMNHLKNALVTMAGVGNTSRKLLRKYITSLFFHIYQVGLQVTVYTFVFLLSVAIILLGIVYKFKLIYESNCEEKYYSWIMEKSGKLDDSFLATIESSYKLRWKIKNGVDINKFDKRIIPETMMRDITLDICWEPLKHSHLFRHQEVYFLRFVSSFMVQKFLIPGEIIFRRGQPKTGMYYISRGVIQVLSSYDGETPIISFSAGTCIGESSLILNTLASNTVLCKDYCVAYVLYKEDYLKIASFYPAIHRIMIKNIRERHTEAQLCRRIFTQKFAHSTTSRESLSLKWLKMILCDLFEIKRETGPGMRVARSIEDRNTRDMIDATLFCPNYLDLLVITDKAELAKGSIFLNNSCPYVLRPDSSLIFTWNVIIKMALMIFLFTFPYYAAFEPRTSLWFDVLSYVLQILFLVDVVITLSTAVTKDQALVTDIKEIMLTRTMSFTFFLDVISILPLDWVFSFVIPDFAQQTWVLLRATKFFKLYRCTNMFEGHTSTSHIRVLAKCFFLLIVYNYYMGAILYLNACFDDKCSEDNVFYQAFITEMAPKSNLYLAFYYAVAINMRITYIEKFLVYDTYTRLHEYVPLLFTLVVGATLHVYIQSNMAAVTTLRSRSYIELQIYTSKLRWIVMSLNLEKRLFAYLTNCVENRGRINEGIVITYPNKTFHERGHVQLTKETRALLLLDLFKTVPFFAELPFEVITEICGGFFWHNMFADEILTHAGEVCNEMHILIDGQCAVLSPTGKQISILSRGACLSAVEMVFKIPTVNTVVTLTDCNLRSIDMQTFMTILRKYPEQGYEMRNVIDKIRATWNLNKIYTESVTYDLHLKEKKNDSFYFIGYRDLLDSKNGREYCEYFRHREMLIPLKYLLLRVTARCQGKFFFYWEIGRCVFAFLTAFLYPIQPISMCTDCFWWYLLLFLDITAWIDIYIRHHVSYFNEKGIEVMHPAKTAIHYWKHAFLVDLLGVLPLSSMFRYLVSSYAHVTLLDYVHVLQIYRTISFFRFSVDTTQYPTLYAVPFVILVINLYTSCNFFTYCTWDPSIKAKDNYGDGVTCVKMLDNYLIKEYVKKFSLTPFRVYFYIMLNCAICLLKPRTRNLNLVSATSIIHVSLVSGIQFFIYMILVSKLIALKLIGNNKLIIYQEAMQNLVQFLSYRRIDEAVKTEIIKHYEYVWQKTQGNDLHALMKDVFIQAFNQDVLYDIYGKDLSETRFFKQVSASFTRGLLLRVRHEIYLKRGLICRVNDVSSIIYIIFKGRVEVLGPDYNKLLVLSVGSMFGNLDDCFRSRRTLTMVAKGHVEVLAIKSSDFYDVLSRYSSVNKVYRNLIALNTDYITGELEDSSLKGEVTNRRDLSRATSVFIKSTGRIVTRIQSVKIFAYTVDLVAAWNIVYLVLCCYVGTAIQFMSLARVSGSRSITNVIYFIDSMQAFNIILKLVTPFEDEFGILVTDIKEIAKSYLKNPAGFILEFASILPLEVIALIFFEKSDYYWILWNLLRSNRIIRTYFLISYFKKKNEQLNINVSRMRILQFLIGTSLYVQILAILFNLSRCESPLENYAIKCIGNVDPNNKLENYLYSIVQIFDIIKMKALAHVVSSRIFEVILFIALLYGCRVASVMFLCDITTIVDNLIYLRISYQENMQILKEHMLREDISPALYRRVWLYLCLLWKYKRGLQYPHFVSKAPYYLREAVMNSMFGFHLRKHPVFSKCHMDLIRQMAAEMQPRTFFPQDYVTFNNDADGCMYFVQEGAVDALSEDDMFSMKVEKTYLKGGMFGMRQGIIDRCGHEFSYKVSIYTVVVMLKRDAWIHLLDFFPASRSVIFENLNVNT